MLQMGNTIMMEKVRCLYDKTMYDLKIEQLNEEKNQPRLAYS